MLERNQDAWMQQLNMRITSAKHAISRKLMRSFKSAFATPDADGPQSDDNRSLWYVDVGHEVKLQGNQNLFPLITESKELLKKQLKKERSW